MHLERLFLPKEITYFLLNLFGWITIPKNKCDVTIPFKKPIITNETCISLRTLELKGHSLMTSHIIYELFVSLLLHDLHIALVLEVGTGPWQGY